MGLFTDFSGSELERDVSAPDAATVAGLTARVTAELEAQAAARTQAIVAPPAKPSTIDCAELAQLGPAPETEKAEREGQRVGGGAAPKKPPDALSAALQGPRRSQRVEFEGKRT